MNQIKTEGLSFLSYLDLQGLHVDNKSAKYLDTIQYQKLLLIVWSI